MGGGPCVVGGVSSRNLLCLWGTDVTDVGAFLGSGGTGTRGCVFTFCGFILPTPLPLGFVLPLPPNLKDSGV